MATETPSAFPTISVIIPCCNRRTTILETLDSVMLQKYPAHEIIVVDDGSTDQTGEIIASKYKNSEIKYIYQENAGSAAARNTGLDHAQGEWIAFLDSDDQWTETKLRDDVDLITSDADIDFIHGNRLHRFSDGKTDEGRRHKPVSDFESKQYLLAAWCIKTSTVLIKRNLLNSLDHYFCPNLKTCQDYELFWRAILSAAHIAYIDAPNVIINLTKDGASRNQNNERLIKDNLKAINNALEWSEKISSDDTYIRLVRYRKSQESIRLLKNYLLERNLAFAIKNIWIYRNSMFYIPYSKAKRYWKKLI